LLFESSMFQSAGNENLNLETQNTNDIYFIDLVISTMISKTKPAAKLSV
jgi:hypothetical protein